MCGRVDRNPEPRAFHGHSPRQLPSPPASGGKGQGEGGKNPAKGQHVSAQALTPSPQAGERGGRAAALPCLMLALVALGCGRSQNGATPEGTHASQHLPVKRGLSINDPKAFQGYTLLAPVKSRRTFLIDMQGR